MRVVLLIVTFLVAAFFGAGFLLPDRLLVERQIEIAAEPARVYQALNGYREFRKWSPLVATEPDGGFVIEGPATGVGARLMWTGNDIGSGREEIVLSEPQRLIRTKLTYVDSWPLSEGEGTFRIEPASNGAEVTWTLASPLGNNPVARWMGLKASYDYGHRFDLGLAALKTYLEGEGAVFEEPFSAELLSVQAQPILYSKGQGVTRDGSASRALGQAYRRILDYVKSTNEEVAGAPLAITESFDDATGLWRFEAAIPLAAKPAAPPPADAGVLLGTTPSGRVARFVHTGPYARINETYTRITSYMRANQLVVRDRSWEEYVNDPGSTPEDQLITNIYFPIQ